LFHDWTGKQLVVFDGRDISHHEGQAPANSDSQKTTPELRKCDINYQNQPSNPRVSVISDQNCLADSPHWMRFRENFADSEDTDPRRSHPEVFLH
jgi:hypothetical protein